jgi:hypothetical protein
MDGRSAESRVFATGADYGQTVGPVRHGRRPHPLMATTYANVTVLGADHDAVVAALGPALADGAALVTDTVDGMTVVFAAVDEEAARFGEGLTAAAVSDACGCAALEVSVFDDDILQYRLYRRGAELDVGVVATPVAVELAELAGGSLPPADAARLVDRLGRGNAALARRALSSEEPIGLASDRHAWLVEALDLPRCAAGWGYRYLTSFPDGFDGGPLTPVGRADPPEEAT